MTIDKAKRELQQFFRRQGRLPSYSEMCKLFGFASKRASFILASKLIEAGILLKDEMGKLIPGKEFLAIPLLGTITAGLPQEEYQNFMKSITIDQFLIKRPESCYALQVRGDSMTDAGIFEGDIVIIDKGKTPRINDIVVAQIDNKFTLKHFKYKQGKIVLMPANSKYKPLYPSDSLVIFGVVTSVIRKYH